MYDLAIIGGGPAGYSAALEAMKCQMAVVLFEQDKMGGTCLNYGCVPTKYLSHMARKYYEAKKSEFDGIAFQALRLDYPKMKGRMREVISFLRSGIEESIQKNDIEIMFGNAVIKSNGVIESMGQEYKTKNIIIATGSIPNEPFVKGAKSSSEILDMDYIPKRMHIIGGGTIAVEFAEIFQMLGSNVSISIRGDRILRKWDSEIAIGLAHSMKKKGIRIHKGCDFNSVIGESDEIIMSAVGRKANLPVSDTDIFNVGENGGILVDRNGQTKTKGIFAAGDVVEGSPQLAHIAMEQGRRIVRYIRNGIESKESAVIRCIYPGQEIASVGLSENEAKEQKIDYIIAKSTMFANARTIISTNERGFIKVIASKNDRKIIGAQLMCEHAGEIVSELALAVNLGITVDQMMLSIRPHPSYCESIQDALRVLENKLYGM